MEQQRSSPAFWDLSEGNTEACGTFVVDNTAETLSSPPVNGPQPAELLPPTNALSPQDSDHSPPFSPPDGTCTAPNHPSLHYSSAASVTNCNSAVPEGRLLGDFTYASPDASVSEPDTSTESPGRLEFQEDQYNTHADTGAHRQSRKRPNLATSSDDVDADISKARAELRRISMSRNGDQTPQLARLHVGDILRAQEAVVALRYTRRRPYATTKGVFPNLQSPTDSLARYSVLDLEPNPAPVQSPPAEETDSRRTEDARGGSDTVRDSGLPHSVASAAVERDSGPLPDSGLSSTRPGWPLSSLPMELYEEIVSYLDRDDIKSMRLVCKVFDHNVSQMLFWNTVVPFNSAIFDLIKGEDGCSTKLTSVFDGHWLGVFKNFGKHIRKFGMSFDLNEDALANAPGKSITAPHSSFWGVYDYPHQQYNRYSYIAGLEDVADDGPLMNFVFVSLENVQELGLSVDGGLGWINGPDSSLRARVLKRPPRMFNHSPNTLDRRAQAQRELWDILRTAYQSAGRRVENASLGNLVVDNRWFDPETVPRPSKSQPTHPFLDPSLISEACQDEEHLYLDENEDEDAYPLGTPRKHDGKESGCEQSILYSTALGSKPYATCLVPVCLTTPQKEWLLETAWAQRAFLLAYTLSVIAHPWKFELLHTLNVSRLSAAYLNTLARDDFWDALPSVRKVVIRVIPSFRTVYKDSNGDAMTYDIPPSHSIGPFYKFLKDTLSKRNGIEDLTIGWVTGGEHAEGMCARNKLLLPSPIGTWPDMPETDTDTSSFEIIEFPHIDRLTLENCWILPQTLEQLVLRHDPLRLKTLILDSVSLVKVPSGPQLATFQAMVQQFQQGQALLQQLLAAQQGLFPGLQLPGLGMFQPLAAHNAVALQIQPPRTYEEQVVQDLTVAIKMSWNELINPGPQAQAGSAYLSGVFGHLRTLRLRPTPGSWLEVLDVISPGVNLTNFGSTFSRADADRTTSLEEISFRSCGYSSLPNFFGAARTQQGDMDNETWARFKVLKNQMLHSGNAMLGEIVQTVDEGELEALQAGWDLRLGWDDEEEKEAAVCDGLLPGGTGRFSGTVREREV